jgi:hypothetical protein
LIHILIANKKNLHNIIKKLLLETTYPQPMYEIKTNKKKDASCLKQAKKVPYMLKWPLKKEAKNKDVATCFQHCKQHTNAKGTP